MINPKHWRVSLPIFKPEAVMDKSTEEDYTNCARLGFYKHGLRRGLPGKDYPMAWGSAYHKYRELLQKLILKNDEKIGKEIPAEFHHMAFSKAQELYPENPPIGHKKEYLTRMRLQTACEDAFDRVENERKSGRIIVTRSEEPVDLEMDWWICLRCGYVELMYGKNEGEPGSSNPYCLICTEKGTAIEMVRARHGGVIDQFITLTGKNFVRDFKTTGMMGPTYPEKFDPNNQMIGYEWDAVKLSGQYYEGVLVETIYNTKKEGPTHHQHFFTYSKGQLEQWEAGRMMERSFIIQMFSRVDELGYLAFPQRTSYCPQWGGCVFREPCKSGSAHEIESWLENYTEENHWDFMAMREGD